MSTHRHIARQTKVDARFLASHVWCHFRLRSPYASELGIHAQAAGVKAARDSLARLRVPVAGVMPGLWISRSAVISCVAPLVHQLNCDLACALMWQSLDRCAASLKEDVDRIAALAAARGVGDE